MLILNKMKLRIKIHPNSSQEKILEIEKDKEYEAWIREKPVDGRANEQLIRILKKYFKKPIKIVHGLKSRNKIVEMA